MTKEIIEIIFKSGKVGAYPVRWHIEVPLKEGPHLAMARVNDGEIGYVPMDIIESFKVLD